MMRLFLDTEFNSYNGEIISLALVSACGQFEFYKVIEHDHLDIHPWVEKNVIGKLNSVTPVGSSTDMNPCSIKEFQKHLKTFLDRFEKIRIYADYPIDHAHLLKLMETGPGETIEARPVVLILDERLSCKGKTVVEHNALSDARGLRDDWVSKNTHLMNDGDH